MKIVFIVHVSLCLIFVCVSPVALSQDISEKDVILCGNSDCTEPVSKAAVVLSYHPNLEHKVALKRGGSKEVYGRLPEKKLVLLRHGKSKTLGFAPAEFLTETRSYKSLKKLIKVPVGKIFPHLVPTQPLPEHVPGGVAAEAGNQTPPSTPYDVLNGTTVFLDTDGEAIEPTATVEPTVKATEIPDKVKQIEDEDDEEGDDDEEEEADDEEEGDESEEEPQPTITPTETDKTNFQTFLDDALNSEPGKNREADERILNVFGGSTQPLPGVDQPVSTSQVDSLPVVHPDTPSLNQVPAVLDSIETPVIAPPQTAVPPLASNPIPEVKPVAIKTPVVASQTPIPPNQVPEFRPQTAVPPLVIQSPNPIPEVPVAASPVEVPVVASQIPIPPNQVPEFRPQTAVPPLVIQPPNQIPEVPVVASPVEVPVVASQTPIPPNQVPLLVKAPNEIPEVLPVAASPSIQVPEVPPVSTSASIQVPETPSVSAPPPNQTPEVLSVAESSPQFVSQTVPLPTEVPPTIGYPPNPTPEAPLTESSPQLVSQTVPVPNEVPTTIGYPPNPTPEATVTESSPQFVSQPLSTPYETTEIPLELGNPSNLTPVTESRAKNPETATSFTDTPPYVFNETDHISDENTTFPEHEALDEAVPTPPPPPLAIRPMYPGLIGMPTVQNPPEPQTGYAEAREETRHESVQTVAPEPAIIAQEPAIPPEQLFDQKPVVETPSNEPLEIEPHVQPLIPDEPETPDSASPGFFAAFTNPFTGLFSTQPSEAITENQPELIPEHPPEIPPNVIPDGECKTEALLETSCDDAPTSPDILHLFDKTVPENSYVSLYLLSTSITVLLFLLGYYFLERTRQDGPLVAKVNQLTHQLQVAKAQQDIKNVDDSRSIEMNAAFIEAQEELNDLRKIKADLEAQLESQQQELDATTEAGLEMNRMLSDLLAQRNASDTLLKSVEHLQGQLNAQQQVIDAMNKSLTEKKEENEALQAELGAAQAKVDNLEEELNDMRNNLNVLLKEKETVMFDMEKTNMELQLELAAMKDGRKMEAFSLNQAVADLKEQLKIRDSEYVALKQTVDDLRTRGGVDVDALYDVGNVRAELVRALTEKEELQERFSEEVGARKLLEDHVKAVDHEVQSLRLTFETAEKEKLEAETKLTVLSNYFKEKENQLHKELGLQEAMWAQKQGDETTIFETIKSLKDEVENYNFDSFTNLNEPLSVTNSISSLCTDAANFISISPKLTEPLSSLNSDPRTPAQDLWNYPDKATSAENLSICSLPVEMYPKPQPVARQKSLKLTEPLSSLNSDPRTPVQDPWNYLDKATSAENLSICSLPVEMCPKPQPVARRKSSVEFEARLKRAEKMTTALVPQPLPRAVPEDLLKLQELKTVRASPFRDMSFSPDSEKSASCSELVEKFEMLQKPSDVLINITPVPVERTTRNAGFDKSESEDSQSTSKDCEVTASSARVEFDIKVVANASSNMKKFKKKTCRPKNGAQNETLKKEILDQERGLKGQIATLEKKAHENWVAARQAERRLEESKQEAGQLRNMLTLMEKSTVPDSDAKPSVRELNGDDVMLPPFLPDGSSPLPLPPLPLDPSLLPPGFMHQFLPPSLAGFMPPPPSHPGEHRPPPLGRMSSPPLNRFSPAPGDFNFDRMSPRPSVRSYRSPPIDPERFHHMPPPPWDDRSSFRPVANQRESRHDYPDSNPNSRPSSTGSLEKPSRRSQV